MRQLFPRVWGWLVMQLPWKRAKWLQMRVGPVQDKPDTPDNIRLIYVHRRQESSTMALILTDEQQVVLRLQPKTKKGNPAKVDGVPVWSTSDPSVLTVTADANDPTGLTALAVAVGPLGTAQVQAVADGDLGSGVRPLTALLDVQVVAAEAATLDIAADAPTETP